MLNQHERRISFSGKAKITQRTSYIQMNKHFSAVLQAVLVVFLWATSWIFVKIGLQDIPPLLFAGLRYFLAFLCLAIVMTVNGSLKDLRNLARRELWRLLLLGVLFYAVTQGAIFVALAYLPAVTVNLLWSFSSILVALLGILWLSEKPTVLQWAGILWQCWVQSFIFNRFPFHRIR